MSLLLYEKPLVFYQCYLRECHVIPLVTSCFCALFVHLHVNFPCQQPVKAPPVLNSTPAAFCSLLLLCLSLFIFISFISITYGTSFHATGCQMLFVLSWVLRIWKDIFCREILTIYIYQGFPGSRQISTPKCEGVSCWGL